MFDMPLWSHIPGDPSELFSVPKSAGFEALKFDHYWPVLTDRWQAFLDRIAPLLPILPPTAAPAPWRSKNSAASARPKSARLKAHYTTASVKFYLSKYRDAIRDGAHEN